MKKEFEISIFRKKVDYWIFDVRCKNFEVKGDDISLMFVADYRPDAIVDYIDVITGGKIFAEYDIDRNTYVNCLLCTDKKLLDMPVNKKWVL